MSRSRPKRSARGTAVILFFVVYLKGCAFCGGLGHRVATCPKLEQHRMKQIMGNKNDDLVGPASRGMGGGGTDW